MSQFPYHRIVVIGTTSSGKSTLAEQIAKRFDLCFIELDALHWEPNWTEAPLDVLRDRVRKATEAPAWVVAGNYHVVRDLIWPKAEAVIWLDYPFWTVFWQLTRRTFKRWWTQELLWGTNRETLSKHLRIWSPESLYHWLFKSYGRRKRETPLLLELPEHKHLNLIHFEHPKETAGWLARL
jgi:adenylate kinase family enzyme